MKLHTKVFDLEHHGPNGENDFGPLGHEFEIPQGENTFSPSHNTVEKGGRFYHVVSWAEATTPEEKEELKQQRAMMRAQRSGLQLGARQ